MMPLLDLTSAAGVRYNGQTVSAVRLNGTTLWDNQEEPEVPLVERAIFASTGPSAGAQLLSDGGTKYGFLASNYYVAASRPVENDWVITGIRLWIPESATHSAVGLPAVGSMAIFPVGPISTPRNTPDEVIAALNRPDNKLTIDALHLGWNEVRYPTPVPYSWHAGVAVGWTIGDGTIYVADSYGQPSSVVPSVDPLNPFVLSGVDWTTDDQVEKRGEYATYNGDAFWSEWSYQNAHYGSDLLVAKLNS